MSPRAPAGDKFLSVPVRLDKETLATLTEVARMAASTPEVVAAVCLAMYVRREIPPANPPAKKAPAKTRRRSRT